MQRITRQWFYYSGGVHLFKKRLLQNQNETCVVLISFLLSTFIKILIIKSNFFKLFMTTLLKFITTNKLRRTI